jgi:DNA adenine methylase
VQTRPFLKWPGGKFRLIKRIRDALGDGKRLIEPFTGSGAVFLNTDYPRYLLADTNPDLINLYKQLTKEGLPFIRYCRSFFTQENNSKNKYYQYRIEFNKITNTRRKSALFLYLNRHCYNGLVRYNSRSEFNTPFGRHIAPYFPDHEMKHFILAADKAEFLNTSFQECMKKACKGDIIYCDPPYAPLTNTACFTNYHTAGFSWDDQLELVTIASKLASRGVQVVISNHDTKLIRDLYKEAGAQITSFQVQRMISSNAKNRLRVGELIAVFG